MKMKKWIAILMAFCLVLALAACGGSQSTEEATSAPAAEATEVPTAAPTEEPVEADNTSIRVAGLKGPTSMGMVNLMDKAAGGEAGDITFSMYGTADEIVPLLVQGELDMAAIPANLAATLYNKTQGGIQVAAVNTKGVLYVITTGDEVQSIEDLKGKTILSTGKGTTPEYILRYLLMQNGIDPDADVTIEYKSEASEVLATMQADSGYTIAVLPQPYVTAAQMQMDGLNVALSLTDEWDKVSDTPLITGVLVVRSEFAQEHPQAVEQFLKEYADSIEAANTDVEGTAALCEQYEIVAKAAIAQKALPACNIVYMDGEEMRNAVSGYLNVLFEADPDSVGGTLPAEDFYLVA